MVMLLKIIAKGKYHGSKAVAECSLQDGSPIIEVDGEFNEWIQEEFETKLEKPDPLGGTYYPPKDSLLAAFSVLQSSFFDDEPETTVEGDIGQIPTYNLEDIVY